MWVRLDSDGMGDDTDEGYIDTLNNLLKLRDNFCSTHISHFIRKLLYPLTNPVPPLTVLFIF